MTKSRIAQTHFRRPGIRRSGRTQGLKRALLLALPILVCMFGGAASLQAQSAPDKKNKRTTSKFDWSDLEENKYKLYGSEKEEKFPVSLFPFIEIEDWDKYYSLSLFSLYKYTRYPRFNSVTFLPFFHHLESKIDDRERFWLFPLVYQKVDGDFSRTVTPLTWKEKRGDEVFRSYGYLFYSNRTKTRLDWGLLPLWYTGHADDGSSSYTTLLPLFYRGSTKSKTYEDFTLLTPGLVVSLDKSTRKDGSSLATNLNFSLLHFYRSQTSRDSAGKEKSEYNWGFPALPVVAYRSKRGDLVHQNVLVLLLDAAWRKDRLERFWLTPIIYYERDADDYLHVLPPVYMSFGKRGESHYQHFLPALYFEWSDKEEETIATPVFYYNNIRRGKKEKFYHEDTVLSPFHYAHTIERGETNPRREKDVLYISVLQALPIYYSNKTQGEGDHRNVLGLIDWSYNSDDSLKRSMVLPLYYYGRSPRGKTDGDKSGDKKTGDDKKKSGDKKSADTPKQMADSGAFHLFPLLTFNWWSGSERNNIWTPLFMRSQNEGGTGGLFGLLYYYNHQIRPGGDEYTNSLFPLFYRNSDLRDKTSFTYATPLYFRSRTPDSDTGLMGGLWFYSRDRAVDSNLHSLIPLYLYSRTGSERSFYSWLYYHNRTQYLSGHERTDLLPLLYYKTSETRNAAGAVKKRDFTFWLSILPIFLPNFPLLYLSQDVEGNHVNLLSFFDWRTDDKGGLQRFWSPFIFYGREGYAHVPSLLWFSWYGSELYAEKSYLAPLFYHNNTNLGWSTLAGPLWLHSNRADDFNLHILPFFYSWKTKTGKTNLLPPLYYYSAENTQERPGSSRRETLFVSPLAYYSRSTVRRDEYFKRKSNTLLPIIPVLYYGSEESNVGSTRTVLSLFHWRNDKEDKLSRFWALPLAYYGRDDYFYFIPLFFRPNGYDAEEGFSISPALYYHSWSRDHDRLFAGIYYTHSVYSENTDLAILFPFYWGWQYPTSKGQLILPFVYVYEDKQKYVNINALGLSRTRNAGKVSFGTTGTGRWFLDTDVSWLYNMVSVSARVSVPSPFGGNGNNKGGDDPGGKTGKTGGNTGGTGDKGDKGDKKAPSLDFFQQMDVQQVGEKQIQKLQKKTTPHLTRKNDIARDDSEYFWGLSIGYGWIAYEIADTKRHFRMFPFAWFSWDTRSDDKVNTIPFLYLSYQSEELQYFALFPAFLPLYGHQRQKKSFVEVYGAFLYIREYDDDQKRHEHSAIWPIFNYHSSPTSNGFRVLPLVWHKTTREKAPTGKLGPIASSRTLSPVFYRSFHRTVGPRDEQPADRPVLVDRPDREVVPAKGDRPGGDNNKKGENKKGDQPAGGKPDRKIVGPILDTAVQRVFILPFAPLWYHQTTTESVFASAKDRAPADGTTNGNTTGRPKTREEISWSYLFPLYFYRARNTEQTAEQAAGSRFTLLGLPFLYYDVLTTAAVRKKNAPKKDPAKGKDADKPTRASNFFLLGYYAHNSPAETSASFLFGLFSYRNNREEKSSKTSLLYGLVSSSSEADGGGAWALPFYYSDLRTRRGTNKAVTSEKVRIAPILLTYYSREDYTHPNRRRSESTFLSPLWFHFSRSSRLPTKAKTESGDSPAKERYSWATSIPALGFLTVGAKRNQRHLLSEHYFNWLYIFQWERTSRLVKKKTKTRTSWHAFPLLWYESGENGHFTLFPIFWNYRNSYRKSSALHIAPLFFSWSRPEESTYIVLGLYLNFAPNTSRQNFFYLFDHHSEPKAKRDTWSALFGSTYMQFTPRRNKFRLFYGLLFGLDYYKKTATKASSYDYNLLWMRRVSNARESHFSFIPFWWYDATRRESTFVFTPLLSYRYRESLSGGREDNIYFLAGLYWRTNPNYRRRNFWFLADYISEPRTTTWNFLFRTVHFSSDKETARFQLFYRLLGGVSYRHSRDYNFNVAWYIQYRDRDQFHSSFLPIWYYDTNKSSSTLVIPPLLTYAERDGSGIFQLVGLGTVWYRNYDSYNQRERRSILLGILYGDVRKPKNGYRSVHSLWGFLWEYQRESETGWSKFSILKLPIYKKVERAGRTRTYIMGVRTD